MKVDSWEEYYLIITLHNSQLKCQKPSSAFHDKINK